VEQSAAAQAIASVVAAIAEGDLWTYGEVARVAGCGGPRYVGTVLSIYGDELPWHRVVRANGQLPEHLAAEQERRLRREGHEVNNGRVRLRSS
jgi:O6-methylguanine-DNA--protein-cysteine methyltransferase